MDVTPLVAKDRQVIESYGAGGFRVSGASYEGAILVLPQSTQSLPAGALADISAAVLAPAVAAGVRILLLGCGRHMLPIPASLRDELRGHGIVIDAMDTGAACRTYNVLLAEDRPVAAALLPAR